MRRRLLHLCLLAYPRASRRLDGDYLRDLALELAEHQGFARQAGSFLIGGVRERGDCTRRGLSTGRDLADVRRAGLRCVGGQRGRAQS
jgi:hypothetical protein